MLLAALSTWLLTYLLPMLLGFVILGIVFEIADRYVGVRLYRWYYNRGNRGAETPHHMPLDREAGLFYGRSLRYRHNVTLVLSALQSAIAISFGNYTNMEIVGEIPALFLEAWFMLPGLWLGDRIFAILKRQDQIFDAIDHKEETAKNLFSGIASACARIRDAAVAAVPARSAQNVSPAAPPEPPKRQESVEEILQRMAEGRKK